MVKWIKITTDIFDDEKIKIIDTMPARDEIIVVWFKLLTLAGKTNQNGMLFMNNKIAYTPEMLSAIFNRELSVIKLALSTFEQFGMIEVEENQVISISNWEKHQNVDGLEKIRIQTAERVKKHREKQKQLLLDSGNANCNVTVTQGNAIEEELELERERERERDKESKKQLWGLVDDLTDELRTAYIDFETMRKSIKKPLTKRALTGIINKVNKYGEDDNQKIQVLEQAIEHCWQTVYELKKENIPTKQVATTEKARPWMEDFIPEGD